MLPLFFHFANHPLFGMQDLGEWKERHDEMEETGNFLAATCRPEVAQEIREKLFFINKKWEDLFQVDMQYLIVFM